MPDVRIICVGKLKERFYTDAEREYTKRLTAYCKTEIIELAECRLPENPSQAELNTALNKEAAAIEAKIIPRSVAVAMCIEGKSFDSKELSGLISGYLSSGVSRVCFIVGGSNGLHDRIKARADVKLSMSKMTFPHNLARIMLLEQLYRCFKIAEGGKYHK